MGYSLRSQGGCLAIDVTGVLAATGGAIAAVPNPWGETVCILRGTWYITTPSDAGANINIGVGATATTDASDIISALAVGGAITGKAYNCHVMQNVAKTEITVPALWHSGDYICFTGSASTVGLVATLFLEVVPK